MGFVLRHRWLWGNNWLNICGGLHHNERTCEVLLCWMWPSEAVKDFTHPSLRLRPENSGGEEEEGRSRGRLTDGLSEWIIDRGLLADAASINSSKPLWWITADKQCWASKCVFNKARWWCCCFPPELQTWGYKLCPRTFSFSTQEGAPLHCSKTHLFTLKILSFLSSSLFYSCCSSHALMRFLAQPQKVDNLAYYCKYLMNLWSVSSFNLIRSRF